MRQSFIASLLIVLLCADFVYAVPQYNYKFRIRTKQGSIIGNTVIHAKDIDAAKFKLNRKYPGCQILNSKQ